MTKIIVTFELDIDVARQLKGLLKDAHECVLEDQVDLAKKMEHAEKKISEIKQNEDAGKGDAISNIIYGMARGLVQNMKDTYPAAQASLAEKARAMEQVRAQFDHLVPDEEAPVEQQAAAEKEG